MIPTDEQLIEVLANMKQDPAEVWFTWSMEYPTGRYYLVALDSFHRDGERVWAADDLDSLLAVRVRLRAMCDALKTMTRD